MNLTWQLYSILVALFNGTNLLLRKWLYNQNISLEHVMIPFTFFWGVILITYSLYLCKNCKWKIFPDNLQKRQLVLVTTFTSALLVTIGVNFNARGWLKVDNGARVDSISQPVKIIFIYLISVVMFGDKIVPKHILGIILCLLGVYFVK